MKSVHFLFVFAALCLASHSFAQEAATVSSLQGAWRIAGAPERVMIVTPNYWSQTAYDREQRQFVQTFGGTYVLNGEVSNGVFEFDSLQPERVGDRFQVRVRATETELTVTQEDGTAELWTRIDAADSPLAGTWRISGRHVDGKFNEMPLRDRRTLKILSGTRFQWVAMNIETGEFSGTGGGTYTFENGKYTEHIEFFSRDGSRVGASLAFDGEVKGDTWNHRGLSSRGDPIDEVWTRFEFSAPQGPAAKVD